MAVEAGQRHLMFDAQRRNPEIILWNRLAFPFQVKSQSGIHGRRCRRDVQDAASIGQPFDFSQILGGAPGIERAVAKFTDDRNRQEEFSDRVCEKGTGFAGQDANGDARIERDAIATHGDRLARTRAQQSGALPSGDAPFFIR